MTQKIVAAAFIVRQGKVLLTKRSDAKAVAPGAFHLPGGHVEEGEQPDEALRRELREELSLSAAIGSPFAAFAYTTDDNAHTVAIIYAASIEPGLVRIANSENAAIAWVSAEDAGRYIPAGDPLLEIVRLGFECAVRG